MTIRDLIKRENNSTLGFALNHQLENIKEWKAKAENWKYAKEFHMNAKGHLEGMVHVLFLTHQITDEEYLDITTDIIENY